MANSTGFQVTLTQLAHLPNRTAAKVLGVGIDGSVPVVRAACIQAYSKRTDVYSQRNFLARLRRFTPSEIASLEVQTENFRGTIRSVLASDDDSLARAACHMVVSRRAFDEIPALVTAASRTDAEGVANAASAACLQLARTLHDAIASYSQKPSGPDPSFPRRWAVTALGKAVDQYSDHRRLELVEAFLLIAPTEHPTLLRVMCDDDHPAHETLISSLRTSPSVGAISLLARQYDNPKALKSLLEIAANRTDAAFRTAFLEALGYPVSERVLNNAMRVGRIRCIEKPTADWFELSDEQQASAMQLVGNSAFSRRTKLEIIEQFLQHSAPLARRMACNALAAISTTEAVERLEQLLDDDDLQVVALAAKALHERGVPDIAPKLSELLDNENREVSSIARIALREFTFAKFINQFDDLSQHDRDEWGQVVVHTDPTAIEQVTRELGAATLTRKLRGLQMTASMGVGEELEKILLKLSEHSDVAIRVEFVRSLAKCRSRAIGAAICDASADPNTAVRNAADQAIRLRREMNLPVESSV